MLLAIGKQQKQAFNIRKKMYNDNSSIARYKCVEIKFYSACNAQSFRVRANIKILKCNNNEIYNTSKLGNGPRQSIAKI